MLPDLDIIWVLQLINYLSNFLELGLACIGSLLMSVKLKCIEVNMKRHVVKLLAYGEL